MSLFDNGLGGIIGRAVEKVMDSFTGMSEGSIIDTITEAALNPTEHLTSAVKNTAKVTLSEVNHVLEEVSGGSNEFTELVHGATDIITKDL